MALTCGRWLGIKCIDWFAQSSLAPQDALAEEAVGLGDILSRPLRCTVRTAEAVD